jgi:hypothetical protein
MGLIEDFFPAIMTETYDQKPTDNRFIMILVLALCFAALVILLFL